MICRTVIFDSSKKSSFKFTYIRELQIWLSVYAFFEGNQIWNISKFYLKRCTLQRQKKFEDFVIFFWPLLYLYIMCLGFWCSKWFPIKLSQYKSFWLILRVLFDRLVAFYNSISIKTVSSKRLFPTLLNQLKLVYGSFGKSNILIQYTWSLAQTNQEGTGTKCTIT